MAESVSESRNRSLIFAIDRGIAGLVSESRNGFGMAKLVTESMYRGRNPGIGIGFAESNW
jgi:hypothetical protein